jgi:hypothetical protein
MLQSALNSIIVGILLVAGWYWLFVRLNRRRARQVLKWLEAALASRGQISAVEWMSPSHFRARLRLGGSAFRQPSLEARLAPRETPLRWVMWRWQRRRETLTFEANLPSPPRQGVEIGRTRWTGLTRRWMRLDGEWSTVSLCSLLISTMPEWEPEISGRMNTAVATRELEVLAISFRARAPHFTVTIPLSESLENPGAELTVFDSLRELAESSPTSRM